MNCESVFPSRVAAASHSDFSSNVTRNCITVLFAIAPPIVMTVVLYALCCHYNIV
jgi:hypothetical protein